MLVSLQEIIGMAEAGNYCIPAFNVYNIETVMGVIKAAEEQKAPVIIQVYPRLLNEEVGYYLEKNRITDKTIMEQYFDFTKWLNV